MLRSLAALAIVVSVCITPAWAAPGWRGDGTGRFPEATPPQDWSMEANILWKTKLADWSNASPMLEDNRIFVCIEPSTLVCLSATDGSILWERTNTYEDVLTAEDMALHKEAEALREAFHPLQREEKNLARKAKDKPADAPEAVKLAELRKRLAPLKEKWETLSKHATPGKHSVTGFSTPTPTSDGQRVFVLFGTGIAAGYDLKGKRLWARKIGKPTRGWGQSASPLICDDKVVMQIGAKLIALEPASGQTLWTSDSPAQWGSPLAASIGDSAVIASPAGHLIAASDGQMLREDLGPLPWNSPVVHDGVLYLLDTSKALALPLGPDLLTDGDSAPTWKEALRKDRYYASPLIHDGLAYAITQGGVLTVLDTTTGSEVYTQPLKFGPGKKPTIYPSPALAGGHLFISADNGVTLVLKPGRTYEEVGRNELEPFRSCPLFVGKRVYIRTLQHLVCIGE